MAQKSSTYCFGCAQPVTHPHQIHRGEDGNPCRACVERVLESVPALLPTFGRAPLAEAETAEPWAAGSEPEDFQSLYEPPEPA